MISGSSNRLLGLLRLPQQAAAISAAGVQLLPECCWGVGGTRRAATATATAPADGQPTTAAAGSEAQQVRQPALSEAEQRLRGMSFAELEQHIRQQFALQAAQNEERLLMLINKATNAEQLQAAVAVVRANHMKRARIRQPQHFSTAVTSALIKAAGRAGAPHTYALELLQQANQLGLSVSLGLCEGVLERCLKHRDYQAASRAWLYAHLYCGTSTGAAGSGAAAAARAAAAAEAGGAAWASKSLIRLYLSGMSQWLVQGGASRRHQQRLRAELEQLAGELSQRGGQVPKQVAEALQQAREQQRRPQRKGKEAESETTEPLSA